jgi:hypothetical protein
MEHIEFHSHEQQDEFVYNIFDQKENGFFLDVACGNPLIGSNTYSLETFKNWTGFCFDLYNVANAHQWQDKRKAQFVQMDATSEQFTTFLKENIPAGQLIDFVSLDIDGLSVVALQRIIDSGVKFKSITFEHEYHRDGELLRGPSREILEGLGMKRLFEDVHALHVWTGAKGHTINIEDWWIHPEYFDPKLLEIAATGKTYKECIEILQGFKNLEYNGIHKCSLAWPDEYTLFWNDSEASQYRSCASTYFS